jgi:AAA15 family ATPase/GTPase
MRIHSLRLQNFKRFTDLTIESIPDSAKLVLLIGSNGCGKSSVFDAFHFAVSSRANGHRHGASDPYFVKYGQSPNRYAVSLETSLGHIARNNESASLNGEGKFFGRSSLRITPEIQNTGISIDALEKDLDAPNRFTQLDQRFLFDVRQFVSEVNKALREPLFNNATLSSSNIAEHIQTIQARYIGRINTSLAQIFGSDATRTIRLENFEDATPSKPAQLNFKKNDSIVPFDWLSHGEKQVVILLINFAVRIDQLRDKIIYIDEMDAHMNTKLQFDLLKEIAEHWIPDDSQLWTASHALGFIEYARQSEQSVIIDFDNLDFDIPQTLSPVPDSNTDVFEIAVPRESLKNLMGGRQLIFCEGKDTDYYSRVELVHALFASRNFNKFQVFAQARSAQGLGLIDRDFLTDAEVTAFEAEFKFIKILRYYSVENYLFHPDNLKEHLGASFDRAAYVADLIKAKNEVRESIVFGLSKARDGYPFNQELKGDQRSAYQAGAKQVLEMLQSDDFETCYKVFPMKDYAKQLPARVNLNPMALAKTNWFKTEIAKLLPSPISI